MNPHLYPSSLHIVSCMIEVDLTGEQTDLQHVKEIHQQNNNENDIGVLTDILSILFDGNKTTEMKTEEFSELIDELPENGDLDLTEIEIEQTVGGIEQLQQILPEEFEEMKVLFKFILNLGPSLDEAEHAQQVLQEGQMDGITLTIPREDESPSGIGL